MWTQIRLQEQSDQGTHCLPECKNKFEKFARICSRRHKQTTFSDADFLGILRVKDNALPFPGTGSGVGTFVLNLLEEEYPDVYRFVTAVYPSDDDDVITSPYNSVLAMRELTEKADCVLPIENQVSIAC